MKRRHTLLVLGFIFFLAIFSCHEKNSRLPFLGNREIVNGDTILHRVPDIALIDQDSQQMRISMYPDKIFISDFFFTSCPSICPKVMKQMQRIHQRYQDDDRVMLISHTIDQRHDSVTVLNRYAKNLGVDTDQWKFVTGQKDSIFHLANQYFVSVVEDPSAPMGFDHSGRIILVDRNRHIRGFAEGTDENSVTAFFETIDQLLNDEYAVSPRK